MTTHEVPLLQVRELSVRYHARARTSGGERFAGALDGVGFEIHAGESVGILGESGCGKTTLALAVLGLLPAEAEILSGSIHFRGRRLDRLRETELEAIRGAEIALVFQDPALALHPMRRVGRQVEEVLRAHRSWKRERRRRESAGLLAAVGLGEAGDAYPHQLSGGQRQRVVIAQALACRPALVIADEPTASLDATTEHEVLELLDDLRRRFATTFLVVSHDPRVLERVTDRVVVMYAGKTMEEGPSRDLLERPLHPYTEALLRCRPPLPGEDEPPRNRLPTLPAPAFAESASSFPATGCRFAPRCDRRLEHCSTREPAAVRAGGRTVWCFLHEDA